MGHHCKDVVCAIRLLEPKGVKTISSIYNVGDVMYVPFQYVYLAMVLAVQYPRSIDTAWRPPHLSPMSQSEKIARINRKFDRKSNLC